MRRAIREFSASDILVYNAGIQHVAPIEKFPVGTVDRDHRHHLAASTAASLARPHGYVTSRGDERG